MDWTKLATILIALYGAGLSTYNLWSQLRARRPHLRVSVLLANHRPEWSQIVESQLVLRVANVGDKVATLADCGARIPGRPLPAGFTSPAEAERALGSGERRGLLPRRGRQ